MGLTDKLPDRCPVDVLRGAHRTKKSERAFHETTEKNADTARADCTAHGAQATPSKTAKKSRRKKTKSLPKVSTQKRSCAKWKTKRKQKPMS
eukprot:9500294-Pyramimonas_sp.AAC.1